ncbi:MAG: sodium-dependent transporter [Lentisphaeria bacterium]|nr:sodium-dependent transporter [Lentisphaeria bacterium]
MSKVHREHWGSSFGFVMAAAGSAIGLGNVWKFPYITGMNGGGAFVLIYLLCAITIGVPVMLAEMSLGRAAQSDVVGSFARFAKNHSVVPKFFAGYGIGLATMLFFQDQIGLGTVIALLSLVILRFGWIAAGYSAALIALLILSYYAMIGGWFGVYIWKALSGQLAFANAQEAAQTFQNMAANGWLTSSMTILFLAVCASVCWFGVRGGVEKASKILMPLLFILMVIMAVRSLMLEGAGAGVEFFLAPDFSKLTTHGVLEAMGHSFFTLSLGMGIAVTYGSYLPRNKNILSSAVVICVLDTSIALLAGLAIFPAVFAAGMSPGAGPGLLFNILPVTFQTIFGSWSPLWNGMFFLLMLIAAITSGISLVEVGVSTCMNQWKISRKKAVLLCLVFVSAFSLLSSVSNVSWENLSGLEAVVVYAFGSARSSFFDLLDYVASSWVLPLNGLAVAIYVGWIWGAGKAVRELYRQGQDVKMRAFSRTEKWKALLLRRVPMRTWVFFILFMTPILVLITFLFTTGFFS